jgi:hypothetical protein
MAAVNLPGIPDTWLSAYGSKHTLIYTPSRRAGNVLLICDDLGWECEDLGGDHAPKGYTILKTDCTGVANRVTLSGKFTNWTSSKYKQQWSNKLYHPYMTDPAAYVERTAETKPADIIPFAEELEALESTAVIEQDAAYEAELDAMYERLPARACIRRDLRPGDDVYIWSRPFPIGGQWTLVGQVLTPADEDNRVLMRYVSGVPMLFALDAKYKYAVRRNAYQVAWRDCEYHASHPTVAEHRAAQADFNRKLDALLDKAAPIMELIQADVHRRIEEVAFKEVKDMAKGQHAA